MFRLYTSHSPDVLAETLAQELRDYRAEAGPLAPVQLVVPQRAMGEWLFNALASWNGAVLNVERHGPTAFAGRMDEDALTSRLFDALQDSTVLRHAGALEGYLEAEPEPSRKSRRTLLLARRFTSLFRRYDEESPGLLEELSQRDPLQAALWDAVKDDIPRRDKPPVRGRLYVFDVADPCPALLAELRSRPSVTVFARSPSRALTASATPAMQEWLAPSLVTMKGWEKLCGKAVRVGTVPPVPAGPLGHAGLPTCRAPSLRRECEDIAARIWERLSTSTTRAHEVAVLLPPTQQAAYLPHLQAAFREAHDLPWVAWDAPITQTSQVARVAEALLELPCGRFRRSELLSLLQHPLVCGPAGGELPQDWQEWIDAVAVFYGATGEDLAGTYLAGERRIHWDQGLGRLALGAFLAGERSGGEALLQLPDGTSLLAEERAYSAMQGVATLTRLARSLLGDALFIRDATLPAPEWAQLLVDYVSLHLSPTSAREQQELGAILGQLSRVAGFELRSGPLPYAAVHALAAEGLSAVTGQQVGHLAKGVVVGTPESLRGIPFDCVFLAGMEAGAWPGRDVADELDVRGSAAPSTRTLSQAALLDVLASTRHAAAASWLARDPLTGEPREPASQLLELSAWSSSGGNPTPSRTLPLVRAEQAAMDPTFAAAFPEAAAEALAQELGEGARKALGVFEDVASAFDPTAQPELAALLHLPTVPRVNARPLAEVHVTLSQLRQFLECHVQGSARFQLRLRPDEETRRGEDDEPFELGPLEDAQMLSGVMEAAFLFGAKLDEAVLERHLLGHVARLQARGRAPLGMLESTRRAAQVALLSAYANRALEAFPDARGTARVLRFGRADPGVPAGEVHPPLALSATSDGQPVRAMLTGRTQLLLGATSASVSFVRTLPPDATARWGPARRLRRWLRNWLDHLVLAASGLEPQVQRTLCLVGVEAGGPETATTTALKLTRARAQEILSSLVTQLLAPQEAFKLPAIAAFHFWGDAERPLTQQLRDAGALEVLHAVVDDAYAGRFPREPLDFAAVRQVADFPHATTPQAMRVAERLDLYLGNLGE